MNGIMNGGSGSRRLAGQVALVAGATRGGGRGIARALGEAGAIVYCTGRSTRARREAQQAASGSSSAQRSPFELEHRPETIEETAEMVTAAGGRGIAVEVDHTEVDAVRALVERIASESGRLDVLVNDIWGGESLVEWGKSFWELDPERAFALISRTLKTHLVTSRFAAPLMLAARRGLIVEVTDGDALYYRSNIAYDLVKVAHIRTAFGMAEELAPHGITALALTPGFLRSEAMLELFGVSEANWRDGIAKDPHFAFSETPLYVGRAVAALASDAGVARHAGRALSTWTLQHEYGFVDADGTAPDWGAHAQSESFGRDQAASQRRFLDGFLERGKAPG